MNKYINCIYIILHLIALTSYKPVNQNKTTNLHAASEYEAMGEELWRTDADRSHENMVDIICPNYLHTTHVHTI